MVLNTGPVDWKLIALTTKLQKRICISVGPILAGSLEALGHCRIVASLSLFYRYYFGRCSYELVKLFELPYSDGRSTCYSNRLHDFSVTFPRCYSEVYVNSFFHCTAKLWNSVPGECFLLIYDLNIFTSRDNTHLLSANSF